MCSISISISIIAIPGLLLLPPLLLSLSFLLLSALLHSGRTCGGGAYSSHPGFCNLAGFTHLGALLRRPPLGAPACRLHLRMAKKRKSENAGLDEVERTLYTSFCTAANSISQLYTQAQNQQKLSFQAGERHAVEKLYQWLLREHHSNSNITVAQILGNLQSELEVASGEEMTMSPGPQLQQQHSVQQQPGTVGTSGRTAALAVPIDQGKISVFQGALSSPNRRCLPSFGIAPSGYGVHNVPVQPGRRPGLILEQSTDEVREDSLEAAPYHDTSATGFGFLPPAQHQQHHHHQPSRGGDSHLYNENDSSMDMHADGAADDYYR